MTVGRPCIHSDMPDLIPQDVLTRALEEERVDLKSRNDIQTVNRLPEDIFVQVLMIAKAHLLHSKEPPCTLFLYTVSQVCSKWRRRCINNPLLWACIHIESLPLSRFTGECISRAKDVPISLDIGPSNYPKLTIDTWAHLLRSLATRHANTERWKTVILRVSDHQVLPNLLEYLDSRSTPNLETISCTRISSGYTEPHTNRRIASSTKSVGPLLPKLRSLELKRVHLGRLFDRNPPIILTSLTRLNLETTGLDRYTPDAFAHLLSSSPHIEELSMMEYIEFENNNLNPWPIVAPITFSSLFRLKLLVVDPYTTVGSGLRWVTRFLRSIHAPKLRQLVIVSPTGYTITNTIVEHFVDFISTGYIPNQEAVSDQSQSCKSLYPELRYFGIFFPLPKGAQLYKSESLLAAFPSLTHLGILGEDIAVVDRTPRCSPRLVYLSIQNSARSDLELENVLRRRQEAGFPIRVVALQHNEDIRGLSSIVELKACDRSQVLEFLDL
ncbi:unnamed protein product [Rhizoctonia solani]|uniref:F-box domain-containing protein n=1 Tax=Rhizoctonia solani TaxID=456999 RepID=A0A8H3D8L0_9AGAM|nr:unnamed protein product [Rhizoctonia solani]CAE6515917.1 unnamed protein product [Rhizoctonia solani]